MTDPTRPDPAPHVVVVKPAARPRWQWYREVVLVLLSLAVLALVVMTVNDRAQIRALSDKLDRTSAAASAQRTRLEERILALTKQVADGDRLTDAQDREIRRLNQLVLSLGGDPTPPSPLPTRSQAFVSPTPLPGPSPTPEPSPSSTPRPTGTPTPSSSPTPTPSPTPSSSCLLVVLGRCVLPG